MERFAENGAESIEDKKDKRPRFWGGFGTKSLFYRQEDSVFFLPSFLNSIFFLFLSNRTKVEQKK